MKRNRIIALMLCFLSLGCGTRYIPNTEIEDTEENREIIAFCERYRHAIEDMNIGLLLSLASPRYYDNSGTITGEDDMDHQGLEQVLKERFKSVKAIRYEFKYIDLYEKDTLVYIELVYTTSFQYAVSGKPKWSNKTADNRIELERVDGGYLIVSGM